MFRRILFFKFLTVSIIVADPSPILPNTYKFPAQSPYNYYGYQQAKHQKQSQTPSPYLYKRNPNSNVNSNSQGSHYSIASTYVRPRSRSSVNQCKLHINCPSRRIMEKFYLII